MGLLRILLAFNVVVLHTNPIDGLTMLPGGLPVKTFFVISGFYMAFIFSGRYSESPRAFYLNRSLQIYPLLWVVAALELIRTAVFVLVLNEPPRWWLNFQHVFTGSGVLLAITYAFSQLTLVGVDAFHLFSWSPDSGLELHGGTTTGDDYLRGWRPFPMSHTWALSCIMLFYALTPLVTRSSTAVLALVCLGVTAFNFTSYLWIDPQLATVAVSFFGPLQLGYFIFGMIAYRFSLRLKPLYGSRRRCIALGILPFVSIFATQHVQTYTYTGGLAMLWTTIFLGMPALFKLSSGFELDRLLGQLSFPVYLVHISCIRLVSPLFKELPDVSSFVMPVTIMSLSLIAAYILKTSIGKAVERVRETIRQGAIKAAPPRTALPPES